VRRRSGHRCRFEEAERAEVPLRLRQPFRTVDISFVKEKESPDDFLPGFNMQPIGGTVEKSVFRLVH